MTHPSFNPTLLQSTPEKVVAEFIVAGILSVDDQCHVWRCNRKVGGKFPRWEPLSPVVRAEKLLSSGRYQIQVYVLGQRITCLTHRLVWFLANGEIPAGHHIHHIDGDYTNNRLENLECLLGAEHQSLHGKGRVPHNRGTSYGKTEAYLLSHETRMKNYAEHCRETYRLYASGISQGRVAEILGITRRQVCARLRSYRENCDV